VIHFSVAIPSYNSADFLGETLESILRQSVVPAEIVVVDDGSTDGTAAVLVSFASRVTSIRIDNSGPGFARKTAIERCTSEWIALCDSDDVWLAHHLERKALIIQNAPETKLVFSNFDSFGPGALDSHTLLDEAPPKWLDAHCVRNGPDACYRLEDAFLGLLYFNIAYTSGMVFSRQLYTRSGGIRAHVSRWQAEDAEFTRRLALAAGEHAAFDTAITWRYRRHAKNYSTQHEHSNIEAGTRILEYLLENDDIPLHYDAEVLREIIARRRNSFMSAYWAGADRDALAIFRRLPLRQQSVGLILRACHSLLRRTLDHTS